uniref:Uncharacterized protein n=1 Tax=Romanomermis culicivorax TaxID=13658 RepID=A0A915I1I3_ROMCU
MNAKLLALLSTKAPARKVSHHMATLANCKPFTICHMENLAPKMTHTAAN